MISTEEPLTPSQQKSTCILCPLPQLTAYWTPPPSCPRRLCCCESPWKLQLFGPCVFHDSKSMCILFCCILATYYFIMDVILLMRFMTISIVEDAKPGQPDEMFSPFTHLSVKAIMNDPTSQYIVGPSAEYFDLITKFSVIFSFITPNMISITHLIMGLIAGKFIASENLNDRRVGVVIFQIRIWLDAFDGVVFRSQNNRHLQFQSVRSTLGYYMDITCDALGGAFLCFGLLFYLFKRFDHGWQDMPASLTQDMATKSLLPSNGHSTHFKETYSKKYLFFKVLFFGLSLAFAGKFWDLSVEHFEDVFQVPLSNPKLTQLQFELSHSTSTIVLFYLWRLLEAQALLQYVLIPIVIDKIWEFLNWTQYILLFLIIGLYLVTVLYVHYVRRLLHL